MPEQNLELSLTLETIFAALSANDIPKAIALARAALERGDDER